MGEPLHLAGLLDGGWRDLSFEPFRPGVDIARLRTGPPEVAVLRYAPGATVPHHRHAGLETIVVLEGAQSDARGDYEAGDLVINPPGTSHDVRSPRGCVVLIQWTLPVEIES